MKYSKLIPLRKDGYQLKEGFDAPKPDSVSRRYVLKYTAIATKHTFIEFSDDNKVGLVSQLYIMSKLPSPCYKSLLLTACLVS